MKFAKAHAYGNDFLYVLKSLVDDVDVEALAREICNRHTGIGADGLILYEPTAGGATMRLINADGSGAEVSGNGVRGLAALLLLDDERPSVVVTIDTDAGPKRLVRIDRAASLQTFRAAMGAPRDIGAETIDVDGEPVDAVVLDMGNPQCVIVGPLPADDRFRRIGAALEHHGRFPRGTNVEFAQVDAADRLRILVWERGVGPTLSSGTGSCAALVAAAFAGAAARDADVIAPGGAQRVEWLDEGVYLTGWAEVVCEGEWLRPIVAQI